MREPQWLRQLLVGSYLRNTLGGGSKVAAGRPVRRQQQGSSEPEDTRRGERDRSIKETGQVVRPTPHDCTSCQAGALHHTRRLRGCVACQRAQQHRPLD